MVARKCILCGSTHSVFLWPKDHLTATKWDLFIEKSAPQIKVKKSAGLCYKHFTVDSFSNFQAWKQNTKSGAPTR